MSTKELKVDSNSLKASSVDRRSEDDYDFSKSPYGRALDRLKKNDKSLINKYIDTPHEEDQFLLNESRERIQASKLR